MYCVTHGERQWSAIVGTGIYRESFSSELKSEIHPWGEFWVSKVSELLSQSATEQSTFWQFQTLNKFIHRSFEKYHELWGTEWALKAIQKFCLFANEKLPMLKNKNNFDYQPIWAWWVGLVQGVWQGMWQVRN